MPRPTIELTAGNLRKLLSYDPRTGIFRRLIKTAPRVNVGDEAGSLTKLGYVEIGICGARWYAHRLAWLYMTGEWPDRLIDHRDGNGTNNAWENLRIADCGGNMQNRRRNNRNNGTRTLGVGMNRARTKFIAHLTHEGRSVHLGTFDTAEEAHAAYIEGKRRLHPGNTL